MKQHPSLQCSSSAPSLRGECCYVNECIRMLFVGLSTQSDAAVSAVLVF